MKKYTQLAVGTLAALCTAQSIADDSQLETVTVIGDRQAYQGEFTPLETPQAELTLDEETLKNAGAVDLNQALDLSASVARQNNFGGLWNSFAIRGFVGDENLPSNYLVNGFNAGRGFGGPRDLSGIESVEVLKGPRAALFGRGEPGGTINMLTKRPTFEKEGELKFSVGSYNTYRTDLDWNTPVSDSAAVRIVGFYEDAESFRDTIETKKQGLSPSVAVQLSDQSQLVYELEYSRQEIPFDRGVIAIDGKLGKIPESRYLGEPGYGPIIAKVFGQQLEFQHDFNDDWSALVGFNTRNTSLNGLASENGFSAPDANGEFGRFSRKRDYVAKYQVLRAEISGNFHTGSIEHRIILGIDADKFENDQIALRDRSTDQSINVFNPVYGKYPESSLNLVSQINRVETQQSKGLYIQDQISLTEQLDIRLGARFDDYEQKLVNRKIKDKSNPKRVREFSENKVSPQFGVVFKASDAFSIYAVYGENFRPLSGATSDNGLDPNNSESTEIGAKFLLNDGQLQANVAIFDVQQSNISSVVDPSSFAPSAIGEASSQGLEIDLNGQITDNISLLASYSFVDAKTDNEFFDPNFGAAIPAGAELLNIPEHQFSLQLVQDTQLAGKELSLIGGLVYVGERNGFFSKQDFKLPSYTTVRVAANYQVTESIELGAEIHNLFDEEYYTNSFSDTWVQPGTPRSFRLSATLGF